MPKQDIKNFSLEELKQEMPRLKEPAYRAEQVFFWLYKKGVENFDAMVNLPKSLRDKLGETYYITTLKLAKHLKSFDGTEKFAFELFDGNFIETVLIYAKGRKTICLSTQVGCKYGCFFCATGIKTFVRNLTVSEIINQILFLQFKFKHTITNYVFMGMGEPLDNYENLSKAILIMNHFRGLDIGARRITISTCGLIPGIEKLKNLKLQVNLSVSIHASNCRLRNELMPVNKKYPLEKLISACGDFIKKTGRMVTFEYILIKGKNDSFKNANELATLIKNLKAKVNLMPYSVVQCLPFRSPSKRDVEGFCNRLLKYGIKTTIRESKGNDIQAACGQLIWENSE